MNYWKISIQKLLVALLSLMGILFLGRIYFFLDFLPPDFSVKTSWLETVYVFLSAFRYDISIASAIIFIPVLGTLVIIPFLKKIAEIWGDLIFWYINICLFLSAFLTLVSHYYFYYYRDHFNVYFWEFWENWENSKLVFRSISHELPIFRIVISFFGFLVLIYILPKIIFPITKPISSFYSKKISLIIIPLILLVGIRGTFDILPLTMQRYRGQISSNGHLNMIHGNPYYEIYASWENQINSTDSKKIKLLLKKSKIKIPQWFNTVSSSDERRNFKGNDLNSYRIEYAVPAFRKKYLREKPRHIVLIFMESHSAWLFSFKGKNYEQNIIKNLEKIKKKSLSFSQYFAAGNSSTSNLMKANFPVSTKKNFQLAFSSESIKLFPNTFPRIMELKGYRTKFFFGGSLNYHRLNYIVPKLGYKEIFGESSLKNVSKNRFGAHDGDLLNFVHQKLLNAKQPTFSFVVTISNHPPYEVPENFEGRLNTLNAPLSLKNKIVDEENFNKRMKALAYADYAIGDFFKKAQKSHYFKETLFILTADHPHSMSLKWLPEEFYQRTKIPLIFYSPGLLKTPKAINKNFGSHLDLTATVLSMISERSFKISSWGRSLFDEPKIKLLTSHFIDCLNLVCISNESTLDSNVYVIQDNEKLTLCRDESCYQESKKLNKIREAFWNSGLSYIFNYNIKKN